MVENPKAIPLSRTWGAIIGVFCLVVLFVFTHYGYQQKGILAGLSSFAILVSIRIRWACRNTLWFWGVIFIDVAIHSAFIYLFHLPRGKYPTILLSPLVILDIFLVLYTIKIGERIVNRRRR